MALLVGLFFLCVGSVFADPFTYLGDLPLQNPDLFGGDILLQNPEDRNAIVNDFQIWPGGVVPYEEDPGLKKTVMKFVLERSFKHYLEHTCIKFVPRTNEKDYIRLFPGQGCYSYVGRVGGQQPVSLGEGCGFQGTIVHELGHAIGFYHEQNRSDRDDYITIYWENIIEGTQELTSSLRSPARTRVTPPDYRSYHVVRIHQLLQGLQEPETMEGKKGEYLRMSSQGKLSPSDIQRSRSFYKC
ncbi:Astacin-like metalloprotease toxin 1 [Araneus ventricosus]|uniref:Metalloendopeptidase n=1 Tax=Araneus ventricosus TaxID=182803 RepID=A0A4Y2N8U2_ARAVE|nr:Astacin-like metalloprotease toxin 1 [Araneus ventricosus]